MGPLNGKKALVCGASEGIGLACAKALASLGASVTLLARRENVLKSAFSLLAVSDGQNHAYLVADMQELNPALSEIKNSGFDILINNSAGPAGGALQNADSNQLLNVFQQHVLARFAGDGGGPSAVGGAHDDGLKIETRFADLEWAVAVVKICWCEAAAFSGELDVFASQGAGLLEFADQQQ